MEKNMQSQSPQLNIELIKAGAGAGKTTALITALMECIKGKSPFPRVAVSTFTRSSARELKERIIVKALQSGKKELIQYVSYSPHLHISTIHGLCRRFIEVQGYQLGFSPGTALMNEQESDELFKSILKELVLEQQVGSSLLEHYSFKELNSIVKHYVLHIQEHPKGVPFSPQEIQNSIEEEKSKTTKRALETWVTEEESLKECEEISHQLEQLGKKTLQLWRRKKQELSRITLSDLEILTLEVLKSSHKTEEAISIGGLWDFWFLDEYQDISPIQKEILDRFAQKSQKVFIVGDPQQSIYSFRDADVSIFEQKIKEVSEKEHSQVKNLHTNYRSCVELIAFFNDFFPKENNFSPIQPPLKKKGDSKKEVARFILKEHSGSMQEKTEEEIKEVLNQIRRLIKKGVKPEEITVLALQNKPLRELAQYLKKNKVNLHLHAHGHFEKRREIQDALFLLYFLLNPHEDENLIGLFRTPYCRITDSVLTQYLNKKNKFQSLWSFCIAEFKDKGEIQKLHSYLQHIKEKGIISTFQKALEELNFFNLSYWQDPTGAKEANLWKLLYTLKEYDSKGGGVLAGFADYLLYDSGDTESGHSSQSAVSAIESSGVQLMTIHASKGLEFKHVILMQVSAGFRHKEESPYFGKEKKTGRWTLSLRGKEEDKRVKNVLHKKMIEDKKEKELKEFDRLLYVALTRAKETVTLIGVGKQANQSWPTRFAFFEGLESGPHQAKDYTYFVDN